MKTTWLGIASTALLVCKLCTLTITHGLKQSPSWLVSISELNYNGFIIVASVVSESV